MDWREFRKRLIENESPSLDLPGVPTEDNTTLLETQNRELAEEALWAHETGLPERGGLLLATVDCPAIRKDERVSQLVIYVLEHGPRGSHGLILNRPSHITVADAVPRLLSGQAVRGMDGVFGSQRVYIGGFEGQNLMTVVHGQMQLAGATPVSPGVCLGTVEHLSVAVQEIAAGRLAAHQFKFFLGHMAWAPGELGREVAAGAWWCVSASRPLVLKQCLQLPVPLWKEVQRLMGGEFRKSVDRSGDWDE